MGIAIKVAALRLASLSLALALFVFGSALSAQAYVDPPPNVLMDENGVNLANGSMHYQLFHTLPAVDPALPPFTRHWMGSGWRDSMMMTLTVDLSATVYTVGIGTSSQRFSTSNGTTFGAHDGATLAWDAATGHYLYTDSSGTIYHFDPAGFGSVQADHRVLARATRIVFPSGATITLTYQTNVFCTANCIYTTAARLQDVSSSNGFSFHFQYASDATGSGTAWAWQRLTKVTRYNRAVETCDPAANSCTFANPWPSIEYGESNVSNLWTETETNSAGETAQFVRMTRNYLISTRRPGSATNDMTVTLNSDLVGQIVRDGRTWVYNFVQTWACCGLWTMTATVSRPGGGQIQTVAYELSGLPISVRDEFGRTTYYTYDAMNLTDIAYPAGNAVHYTYDARSNQTSRTLVASIQGTPPDIVTSASFDPVCSNRVTCNRPNSTTDANQNTTDYAYDPVHGGVLTETLPAPTPGTVRPQTRYQYAQLQAYFKNSGGSIVASGVPTWLQTGSSRCRTLASCAGSADEAKTAIDFGPQSAGTANNLLPVASSAAAGDNSLVAATTTSYDPNGWRLTEDGPLAGAADTSRFRYDVIGRLIGIAGPDPDGAGSLPNRAVRTTYNADGRPTLVEQGTVAGQSDAAWAAFSSLQQQGIGYDAAGRKATETRASGGATFALTQFSYDAAGRPECAAVRMNAAAFGSLPASACTLGTTGSFGPDRIVRRSYDIAGRLLQLRSAVGTAEEGADETRTYTGSGMVETIADGEGNLTTYGYDGLDRLTTTWFPVAAQGAGASSTTDYELLGMDAAGNIVSRRRRDGTSIGYTYDALNRVIFKDIPAGAYWEFDITYTYDNLGHLLSAADPYVTMGHGYDALGRQVSESSNLGSETMSYDLAGRLTRLTWHDSFYVDYDHLVTGEVSAIRENGATSGIGVLATYGYDDRGRRTSLTRGNGTTTSYGYDNVDRLTRIVHDLSGTSYDLTLGDSYDPAGGIVSHTSSNDAYAWGGHYAVNRSYTANGLNQYTATGAITPTYDSRGNLISAGSTSYAYTSENRLATAGNIYLPYQADGRLWEI
ncbi:MAG TPA: hypothetical protein VK614_00005, partial [Allosphingosinicella sp.]|nr:hypothetical protein [Allosphingosinicella sp.]